MALAVWLEGYHRSIDICCARSSYAIKIIKYRLKELLLSRFVACVDSRLKVYVKSIVVERNFPKKNAKQGMLISIEVSYGSLVRSMDLMQGKSGRSINHKEA